MASPRIDQVIPSLASRDAIGGHVLQLRDLLRTRGFRSDIYYGNATPDRLDFGYPVERLGDRSSPGRVLLYQLSIGSGVGDIFRDRSERKFVNYHNITPADLLEPWIPAVGEEVRWGRAQLEALAPVTEFAVADSRFNEQELIDAGYPATATVPLLIDLDGFAGQPDPVLAARLGAEQADGGTSLLFVGKVSPHKAQHDLVKALAAYRQLYDPKARLRLVGGAISEDYRVAVERFADELGLVDAVEIAGSVTHEELIAYYAATDVFVCLSNHEGFCVPLLEAMYHQVPIVAHTSTAVPETVDGAGLVLPEKNPALVAAAIDRVVTDDRLRAALAQRASERVASFSLEQVRASFASALESAYAARERIGNSPPPTGAVRLAFVVPRYGPEIIGGAETAARLLAEHLATRPHWAVEVLTTCARDFVTWDNDYPAGDELINGVLVRRFTSTQGREPSFHPLSAALLADPVHASAADAERWLDLQGPICPELAEAARATSADALSFYPYLYWPTARVIDRVSVPTILHPAAHDEPALKLSVFPRVFAVADGLVFQTTAERDLVERTFPVAEHSQLLLGLGVDDPDLEPRRPDTGCLPTHPYLVCLGRVEGHKGSRLLASLFAAYKARHPGPLRLIFAGPVVEAPDPHPEIDVLGPVDEATKWALLGGAVSLVSPSPWEAFSLVLAEAWSARIPVVVNSACAATSEHCRRSGGGLAFDGYGTFEVIVDRLTTDGALRAELGALGRSYVDHHFRWPVIVDRYARFVQRVVELRS